MEVVNKRIETPEHVMHIMDVLLACLTHIRITMSDFKLLQSTICVLVLLADTKICSHSKRMPTHLPFGEKKLIPLKVNHSIGSLFFG